MVTTTSALQPPIKFGTDGWRGVIADDFTFERLAIAAPAAAQTLAKFYGQSTGSKKIIIGHDRRFMAEEFAQKTAETVQAIGFDVLLTEGFAPTPAFSWAAKQENALGALVITASHNPGSYLGLKVKGAFGGSVPPEVTQEIEQLIASAPEFSKSTELTPIKVFDPWPSYCAGIAQKVDLARIQAAIQSGRVSLFADVMHGAAAGGLTRVLGVPAQELHSDRDPMFGGAAPEPLPKYLSRLFRLIRQHGSGIAVGFVFDGDSDRIAAVDSRGNFLSSQVLIPILIDHLAAHRGLTGEVVKTISGSDLIPKVAALHNLPVYETPIGYKYIADRMLSAPVLLGGEESGGIGYGGHIPERDALLSALYLLEAIVTYDCDLGEIYQQLQRKTAFSAVYDRLDLHLNSMDSRRKLEQYLQKQSITEIAGQKVLSCLAGDGYKFRLGDQHWLLIRFSGTEPLLRLYCEAMTAAQVQQTLQWAKDWANDQG